MTNEQLGVTPQQQSGTSSDAFAQSMQAWQAARQAELAGLKSTAPTFTTAPTGGHNTMGGYVNDNNPYGIGQIGGGGIANYWAARGLGLNNTAPTKPVAPVTPTFSIAPIPTDPQQYMTYVAQQQAAFNKQKLDYQNALNAYKG